jgi:hypothetical protein
MLNKNNLYQKLRNFLDKEHLVLFSLLKLFILPFIQLQSAFAAQMTIVREAESGLAGYDAIYYRSSIK